MNMKKHLISCLCATTLAIGIFAGCGKDSESENATPTPVASINETGSETDSDDVSAIVSNELVDGTTYVYGMMNIPYADFYAAEGILADTVDAVTTASTSKWGGSMTTGSYKTEYDSEGGNYGAILGVTYPVAISEADYATLQANLQSLRAAKNNTVMIWDGEDYNTPLTDTYSYEFTELSETPAAFKVASFDANGNLVFSKINGNTYEIDASKYTEINAEFGEDTTYGEYQLNWTVNNSNSFPVSGSGMFGVNNQTSEEVGIMLKDGSTAIFQLKAALVVTDGANNGGKDTYYAMRHMENIWVGARYGLELAWSAGITEYVHNTSILDTVHYASTMGETVKQIIFIADDGYYTFDWEVYLPYILADDSYTLEVNDASVTDEEYGYVMSNFPKDFNPRLSIEGVTAEFEDEHFHIKSAIVPGSYTLTVKDHSEKYAPVSTTFTLTTDTTPAVYDAETNKLVVAEGATDDDLANYIKNISKVSVNDKSYSASGRGSVKIVTGDGTIDTGTTAFDGAGEYMVSITSTGYTKALTFTVTVE